MTKKSIIVSAPLLSVSGYGVHSRQLLKWLFDYQDKTDSIEVFCEPVRWGDTSWITDTNDLDGLVGRVIQQTPQNLSALSFDVSFQLKLPNEFNPFLADYNIGLTAGVETDKCNPEWIDHINKMDLMVVPSEFVKQVFLTTAAACNKQVTVDVQVIPESYFDELTENHSIELPNLKTDFNFLVFGQFTGTNPENDRKNLFYTIKWLAETFKDNPNVGVIVKTNLSRNTVLDKTQVTSLMTQLLVEVNKTEFPKFYLLHGDMTNSDVAGLYKHPTVKALVSCTKGEGFGLPLLEAAVSGLPVIVTNWSAHKEFLGKGKFVKLDFMLKPVHESRVDNKIFMPGVSWAHPMEDDVKRKLKKFHESPQIPTQWAKELSVTLKEQYSSKKIAELYTNVFEQKVLPKVG